MPLNAKAILIKAAHFGSVAPQEMSAVVDLFKIKELQNDIV